MYWGSADRWGIPFYVVIMGSLLLAIQIINNLKMIRDPKHRIGVLPLWQRFMSMVKGVTDAATQSPPLNRGASSKRAGASEGLQTMS